MAVIIRMVFGDTVGLVAGGVTAAGRTMAAGNGSLARFVGFAARPLERGASANQKERPRRCLRSEPDPIFCVFLALYPWTENTTMKTVLSLFTLAVGLAFTVPAFAQADCSQNQTQEDCVKNSCYWHADTKTCSAKPG